MEFEIHEEIYKCKEKEIAVQRRGTWIFQVMCNIDELDGRLLDDEGLIKKHGGFTSKVVKFMDLIRNAGTDWTLAYYSGLIAFKNPADRVTYIYNAKYFKKRFAASGDSSIFDCKSIRFD